MGLSVVRTGVVVGMAVALVGVLLPPLTGEAVAVAPSVAGLVEAEGGLCGGLPVLVGGEHPLCTHGPDDPPAAAAAGASSQGDPVPQRAVTCIGDGSSGQRVEVVHVHQTGTSPASSSLRRDMTRWSEQVEWTVHESARRFGGDRRVRWRTDSCALRISSRTVSSAALRDFGTMIDELRDLGYTRSDRTYLLFVDASTYCGIATAPRDDRADSNRADRTTGYARVDRPCWDVGDRGYHSIAAHELFHTLGAVQASAPHGTSGAHCTDEHDLLCYDDGTGDGVRTVCRDGDSSTSGAGDANDRLLDCRGDDYFHPAPPTGSYLDQHWNTADSARLHDPNAPQESGDSGAEGGGGGSGGSPPGPTSDPVGYVFDLLFG